MRPLHRRAAVAAAALAALVSVSACGSSGSPHDGRAGAQRSPAPAASIPDPQTGTGATPSPSAKEPVLPDSELTPVTGSFSKRDKKYLSGRVPQNMDPSAVLQTGQESCQRVARTAAHDKDAAVGAVIAGDIPDAKAAITLLCPDQKPVLRAADAGFPDGTRKNPRAGTYRALTTAADCSWRVTGSGGKVLASGPGTGAKGTVEARIPAGSAEFTSTGCYAWVPA
ncbi:MULTISPECIES: hypothetical protein [unclassified Streptomyces]|uniref:hypothetical protein n=1 Tax=unclassified Streptomyces TaxID=2593676 RepID=UPI002E1F4687|nr:hypothetical protein OG217_03615 [Streptomyces sp. NBC_01023]